jgi:hypothetical protein
MMAALLAYARSPSSPTATATGAELWPDLQTQPPKDLEVVGVRVGPRIERRLRFDNEVANRGPGPFEVFPVSQDCNGDGDVRNDRTAMQRIYQDSNGSGAFERGSDTAARTVPIGCMTFHPQHHHWHLEQFAGYALRAIRVDGTLGPPVAASTKVSFCIIDVNHPLPELVGSPTSAYYTTCGRNDTTGISVGWSDEYRSTLADQYVVISGVPDGVYCLVSTSDPPGRMVETTTANNAARVRVTLSGNTATPRNPTTGDACGP